MAPSFKISALALACASTAFAGYVLEDDYSGPSFFDGFEFITTDPTLGYVDYLTHDLAKGTNRDDYLINYNSTTGTTYIGVDYWSTLNPAGTGRASVRIESTKKYQYGLIILDLAHMPSNQDGLWPAFWTASHIDYPAQGEIDIMENIHSATISRQALHTNPGCSVTANQVVKQQTGNQISYDCDDNSLLSKYGKQYFNEGCVAEGADDKMYGDAFNKAGGGVYATEWTSDAISIWFFGAGNIPADITNGAPIPSSKWGKPAFTTAHGSCVVDDYFKDHQIILNTDFCGTWAGKADVWQSTDSYSSKYPTCESYVAANPKIYKNSYWEINSIKVYTNSTTSSTTSSSSSIIRSTSTAAHTSSSAIASTLSTKSSVSTSKSPSTTAVFASSSSPLAKSPSRSTASPLTSAANVRSSPGPSSSTSQTLVHTSSSLSSSNPSPIPTSGSVGLFKSSSRKSHSSTALPNAGSFSSNSTNISASSVISLPEFTPVTAHLSVFTSVAAVSSSVPYKNSTTTSAQKAAAFTTSTVYATSVYTVTSCAPTVTNCPAKLGQITTEKIKLYTTVCPVTETETSEGIASLTSSLTRPRPTGYTASSISTTSVHLISTCAPTATDCVVKTGSATTIALYTTQSPISASESLALSSLEFSSIHSETFTSISSQPLRLSTVSSAETRTSTTIRTVQAPEPTEITASIPSAIPSQSVGESAVPSNAVPSSATESTQASAVLSLAPSTIAVGTGGLKTTSAVAATGTPTIRPVFEGAANKSKARGLMTIMIGVGLAALI